ncbi:MAG TPA: hypothetical protein VK851_08200, partial [Anaerolineales bacterium]|nr:hypothetical protein [Anaerolineales bacterium]
LLNYYKQLLRVRRNSPALIQGEYLPLHEDAKGYFAFLRVTRPERREVETKDGEQTVLVVLNYAAKPLELDFSQANEIERSSLHVLFSSAARSIMDLDPEKLHIGAFEVLVAEVE